MSARRNDFNGANSSFNTTTTSFLLSAYSLIMSLLSFTDPFIIDEAKTHKTEGPVVNLYIYSPWFTFGLINIWDVEMLEDAGK
ncbi:hypothetical protein PanWU01x14_363760 [Parasponia andersonii]|uniref:Uncharacterized protein n=1 Tax=Parasponia andersonii TaxID=3476 RepID=A0A2P5A6I5_PARAD|nr:hypothetical protein PanWU01x14_363760 [Parasponia andersonii]